MSFYSSYPASISSNPSVGSNGAPIPTSSTEVAGTNPSGNLTPLSVDASGNLNVNVVSTLPNPLPVSGTVTANQGTAGASAWPVSAASLPLPAGASTSALQTTGNTSLSSIDSKTPALGQQLAAASQPVVLTAAQLTTLTPLTSVTVTQATAANLNATVTGSVSVSNFPATQPVSGTVAATQSGTWNITNISGTQTLPTGASTSALQSNVQSAPGTPQTIAMTIQGNSSGVAVPISVASLPLPAGAATSALQTTGNTSLATIATNSANIPTVGQKTMAASQPVVIASNQSVISVTPGGKALANAPTVTTYATPVTSSAYTTIVASTTSATTLVEIFDSSGVAIFFAVGAAAAEVNQFVIYPGGNGQVPLAIPAGSRISYKAVSTSATGASAYNVLNLYS